MQYRSLGASNVKISAVGLGCAGMSEGYGTHDDEQSLRTLSAAAERGVNFFDTSDAYGMGHNEELLGRFLKTWRDPVVIATKFGIVRKQGSPAPFIDNSPEYIRQACEASLRRLGLETIDLFYAHRRNPAVPIEDMVGAMAQLVQAGKVRHLGLSEVQSETLRRAHAVHPIAAIESEYSLWTRDPEAGVLNTCAELGVTFVAYCPLGRAFLTGTLTSTEHLEASDFRRRLPRFQLDAMEKNSRLVRKLQAFAAKRGVTSGQIALAWLLSKHPHVVAIPGTKQPRYATENAAAADITLGSREVLELDALFPPAVATGDRYPAPAMAGIEVA